MTAEPLYIVYDGECPFCTQYVKILRLRDAVGTVELLDARKNPPILQEINALGLDLDEGMACKINGVWYHGADCVHRLALLTSSSTIMNRLNAHLFKLPCMTRAIYPFLRFGRNSVLRILGRSKIDNLS